MLFDLDPVSWARATGYKEDLPYKQSRKNVILQSQLDGLKNELSQITLLRAAKRATQIETGTHPLFERYKTNYLLENPFKVKGPGYQVLRDIKSEYQRISMQPGEGEDKSKKFEGLTRGMDYPLSSEYAVGVTKDDTPYLKDVKTGAITVVGPMHTNYDNLVNYLRTRMRQSTAQLR